LKTIGTKNSYLTNYLRVSKNRTKISIQEELKSIMIMMKTTVQTQHSYQKNNILNQVDKTNPKKKEKVLIPPIEEQPITIKISKETRKM